MWVTDALKRFLHLTGGANGKEPEPLKNLFDEAISDAALLMTFAAETGTEIDPQVRNDVLQARASGPARTPEQTANLLTALTVLAKQLKPVTAESLKVSVQVAQEKHTILRYWIAAALLILMIVPYSVLSFVTTATSDAIRDDIASANGLAVKLTTQLEPLQATASASTTSGPQPFRAKDAGCTAAVGPANTRTLRPGLAEQDVATEIQQFASEARAIYRRAHQLNPFLRSVGDYDPFNGCLPQQLLNIFEVKLPLQNEIARLDERIRTYQEVRYFAQTVTEAVSFWYGAVSTCVLPVLYALLGACAFLMRSLQMKIRTKTYVKSVGDSTRLLVAGIGGAVVGLFNNVLITKGPSIPPFAFAFLVGYATDVFFTLLDGSLQAYTKVPNGAAK